MRVEKGLGRAGFFIFALVLGVTGCHSKAPSLTPLSLAEPGSPVDGAVEFDIAPAPATADGTSEWNATYKGDGGVTKFRFRLTPKSGQDATEKGLDMSFGKGEFTALEGSDPQPLLNALKITLQAKSMPQQVKHVSSLPFTYATLGTGMRRAKGGGFDRSGPGNWIATKLFLPTQNDEDEAEVFLNLNPVTKRAEFSIKDPDYGDDVLKALATVL